jgi:hypothetical protein
VFGESVDGVAVLVWHGVDGLNDVHAFDDEEGLNEFGRVDRGFGDEASDRG